MWREEHKQDAKRYLCCYSREQRRHTRLKKSRYSECTSTLKNRSRSCFKLATTPESTADTSQVDFAIGKVLKKRVCNALRSFLQPQQLVKCWCACQP